MEEGLERVDHWGAGEYAFDSSVLRDLPAAVPSEAMDRGALTSPACLSRFLETYTYRGLHHKSSTHQSSRSSVLVPLSGGAKGQICGRCGGCEITPATMYSAQK